MKFQWVQYPGTENSRKFWVNNIQDMTYQTSLWYIVSIDKELQSYQIFRFFFWKKWKYFSNEIIGNLILSVKYRKINSIDTNLRSENTTVLQCKLCIVQQMPKVRKYFCELRFAHDTNCRVPRYDLLVIFPYLYIRRTCSILVQENSIKIGECLLFLRLPQLVFMDYLKVQIWVKIFFKKLSLNKLNSLNRVSFVILFYLIVRNPTTLK